MDTNARDWFWYFIREREAVRIKKDKGKSWPWSEDEIINDNHFCNVRREDDRGTKDIRAVVLDHAELVLSDLPWVYTMARLFNKASTLDSALSCIAVGEDWQAALKEDMKAGLKIFHTAYVVSTNGRKMNKVDFVAELVESVKKLPLSPFDDLDETFDELITVPGIGSFLAGQIIADLKNDRFLTSAGDWFTWSSPGPGSKKGLDFIFPGARTTDKNYDERIRSLWYTMPDDISLLSLHMQDLQNCLCEFSKYMMIKTGTRGRSRPYYRQRLQ